MIVLENQEDKPSLQEKRNFPRKELQIQGIYSYLGQGSQKYKCYINNISEEGLHLTGDQSFMIGDNIEIEFCLANKTILVHLETVHVFGRNAGAKFTLINKADLNHIKENLLNKMD